MIEIADSSHLTEIIRISLACRKKMNAEGIFQWNEDYPTENEFEDDIKNKELHILKPKGNIIGTITFGKTKDEVYKDVRWIVEDGNSFYVHRLMIDPNYQGQGYAKQLMQFVEQKAFDKKLWSIRLDTFSKNRSNQQLYQDLGYVRLPYSVYFPSQSKDPFYCYEKVLIDP